MSLDLGFLANVALREIIHAYERSGVWTEQLYNRQPNVWRDVTCRLTPMDRDDRWVIRDLVQPMAARLAHDLITRNVHHFLEPSAAGFDDNQRYSIVCDSRSGISIRARMNYDATAGHQILSMDVWGWSEHTDAPPIQTPRPEPARVVVEARIVEVTRRLIELPE